MPSPTLQQQLHPITALYPNCRTPTVNLAHNSKKPAANSAKHYQTLLTFNNQTATEQPMDNSSNSNSNSNNNNNNNNSNSNSNNDHSFANGSMTTTAGPMDTMSQMPIPVQHAPDNATAIKPTPLEPTPWAANSGKRMNACDNHRVAVTKTPTRK
jgi:hypothetical protein